MAGGKSLATCLLLLAAFLRLHHLHNLPPGWRDDEVVETTVHAQIILDGRFPIYFPQAEGHEPLYHYLSAGLMAVGGRSLFTVRLLSVYLGLFSLAAAYRFTRRFFGPRVALLTLAALAVSFWSLMYARFKLRHISELGFMLLTFDYVLRFTFSAPRRHAGYAALAGICLALGLHTYFAARAVPLILLAFCLYLALFHWPTFKTRWRGLALIALIAGVLTAPLAWAIAFTPNAEARLSVVGQPLQELLQGHPQLAFRHTLETLGMFAFTGDPEFLYNIPGRPVFEWVGATLFFAGALLCLWRWRQPRSAFLLIWLLGGLAPAFVSVPSASLGHTIAAQPVVYLLPAVALRELEHGRMGRLKFGIWILRFGICLFLGLTAFRDLRDYFVTWPALPEVRDLYRADLHEATAALRAQPPATPLIALASRNLHQADVVAFQLETPGLNLRPRLFNPEWAWLFAHQTGLALLRQTANPGLEFGQVPLAAPYAIRNTFYATSPENSLTATFLNGWTCTGYTLTRLNGQIRLATYWHVEAGFSPPPPRPVEVLAGSPIPLKIFSHLLQSDGTVLAGDDRLDIDPATLQPGDDFIQVFYLPTPTAPAPVEIGLYNPVSGDRILLSTGNDYLILETVQP